MKKNPYSKLGRKIRRSRRNRKEDVFLREGFERLRKAVNKFQRDGDVDWHPEHVMEVFGYATEIYDEEFMSQLRVWEQQGYIKIIDTVNCLFRVIKPFEQE